MVLLGVAGIGFLNFLVSFALAFHVAMRSRGLRMKDVPGLPGMLWRHFRSHPLDFFRPPATARRRYDEMPGKIRTSN
jgi:site-specific recombinase